MKELIDILIVEDNLVDQKLLSGYLQEYDINFSLASDGFEAQYLLTQQTYQLILLDLSLPKMNGYQLTTLIRQKLKIETPIVAITAYEFDEVKDQCFSLGMNGCFAKPVGRVELMGILTQFLLAERLQSAAEELYEWIDLTYLQEISLGDQNFEIEIAQKFIETIEIDCQELKASFLNKNYKQLKAVAHRMLSTIYVMGLKPHLEETLRSIETDAINEEETAEMLSHVFTICQIAVAETKQFISNAKDL